MQHLGFGKTAALALLFADMTALPPPARAQNAVPTMPPRFVVTEKAAYLPLPPELIAGPVVTSLSVAPDGRFVLAERVSARILPQMVHEIATGHPPTEPASEVSLVLWDSRTHTAREVWKSARAAATIQEIVWLPRVDVAFVHIHQIDNGQKRQVIYRIAPTLERAQSIAWTEPDDQGPFILSVSPTQPLAVLTHYPFFPPPPPQPDGTRPKVTDLPSILAFVDESGHLGPQIQIPADRIATGAFWSENGVPFVGMRPKQEKTLQWFALDPRTAVLQPLERRPARYQAPPTASLPLHVRIATQTAQEGQTTQKLAQLWLESVAKTEKPRALLCGDCSDGRILPGGDMVVYTSQGAAWAIPLVKLSKEEYATLNALALKAEQIVAFNNAKQVGLGLLMFAEDHNETLPSADDLNAGAIDPYLKNADVLTGFNYTYAGGPLADIANPATTELGYIDGPGGRIILYADGHVKQQQ